MRFHVSFRFVRSIVGTETVRGGIPSIPPTELVINWGPENGGPDDEDDANDENIDDDDELRGAPGITGPPPLLFVVGSKRRTFAGIMGTVGAAGE